MDNKISENFIIHISCAVFRLTQNYDGEKKAFAVDSQFLTNLEECNKRGIPYGIYILSRANTVESTITEAKTAIEYLDGLKDQGITFKPSLPIYGDFLEPDAKSQLSVLNENNGYNKIVDMISSFCEEFENAGYFAGVYMSASNYNDLKNRASNSSLLDDYIFWIAHYGDYAVKGNVEDIVLNGKVTLDINHTATQQITDKATVPGIYADMDVNIGLSELREIVRQFYISNGASYDREPQLSFRPTPTSSGVALAPYSYTGNSNNTNHDVTEILVKTVQGENSNCKEKSLLKGSKMKYTNGKPGLARFNKGTLTRTLSSYKQI